MLLQGSKEHCNQGRIRERHEDDLEYLGGESCKSCEAMHIYLTE